MLIKPIQRIQKYHLLVKKILTYSETANEPPHVLSALRDAVQCTSTIPKNANNMMELGRLQGFTVRQYSCAVIHIFFFFTDTLFHDELSPLVFVCLDMKIMLVCSALKLRTTSRLRILTRCTVHDNYNHRQHFHVMFFVWCLCENYYWTRCCPRHLSNEFLFFINPVGIINFLGIKIAYVLSALSTMSVRWSVAPFWRDWWTNQSTNSLSHLYYILFGIRIYQLNTGN